MRLLCLEKIVECTTIDVYKVRIADANGDEREDEERYE